MNAGVLNCDGLAWPEVLGKALEVCFMFFLNKRNPKPAVHFPAGTGRKQHAYCHLHGANGSFLPLGPVATCQFSRWPVAPSMKTAVAVGNPESP